MNRRNFARLLSGSLLGLALPRAAFAARPQESYFTWVTLGDGVHAAIGGGGNTLLVRGSGGALQSDAKNFGLGTTLRREAEALGTPVRWFVNTHHHGDHSGGNAAFADVERIAHLNTEPRIRETAARNLERADQVLNSLAEAVASGQAPAAMEGDIERARTMLANATAETMVPAVLHTGERMVDVGGVAVELRWVSRGHTDGDTFLYLPERNVMHGGDLLFYGRHPFVDVSSGATPQGWLACLGAMLRVADADTVVVPGHGEVGGIEVIEAQRDYFLQLMNIVESGMVEGRSREEIVAAQPQNLVELAGSERFLPTNLGIVFDEMAG